MTENAKGAIVTVFGLVLLIAGVRTIGSQNGDIYNLVGVCGITLWAFCLRGLDGYRDWHTVKANYVRHIWQCPDECGAFCLRGLDGYKDCLRGLDGYKDWDTVNANYVRHIWQCPDECEEVAIIHSDWYQDNGTPVCTKCDRDMIYVRTEVKDEPS